MDPISSVDRMLIILRKRLSERARTERKAVSGQRSVERQSTAQSVAALAAVEGIDDRQIRRSLIQSLLAEQLGAQLINDARFQQVVGQVSDAIDQDAAARGLIDHVVAELMRQ